MLRIPYSWTYAASAKERTSNHIEDLPYALLKEVTTSPEPEVIDPIIKS